MYPHLSFKGRLLRKWLARRGSAVMHLVGPSGPGDLALVRETRAKVPLLVQDAAAFQLLAAVRASAGLGRAMAEAGVYAGGTARLICAAKGDAPLHLFDVFETLQGASGGGGERAGELARHFGSVPRPLPEVEHLLAGFPRVHFHPGVFPATTAGLEDERFSFVHLDLDLEASTRDALEFFLPRLLPGGVLIGDDYEDPLVRRTFAACLAAHRTTALALPWGQVVVVKLA